MTGFIESIQQRARTSARRIAFSELDEYFTGFRGVNRGPFDMIRHKSIENIPKLIF